MNSIEALQQIEEIRYMFAGLMERGDGNQVYYEGIVYNLDRLIDRLRKYMDRRVSDYYKEAPKKVKKALEAAEYARDFMGLRSFDMIEKAIKELR